MNCTRDAGHEGPCNGYPRLDGGLHCYTLRKVHESLGAYLDSRLQAQQTRILDLEAENARLSTRVNELIALTSTDH